jgi:hypothetical protein
MTRRTAALDERISATQAVTARAASAALRKTHCLAHAAPLGRAFSSIATLSELTERIEGHLVSAHDAFSGNDESLALSELDRARALADGAIIEARPDPAEREPTPKYLIRRR